MTYSNDLHNTFPSLVISVSEDSYEPIFTLKIL